MPIQLPEALLRSYEYLELNEKQAFNFQARLDYIDEIVDDITQWVNGESDETLNDFLRELELDVMINQASIDDPDTQISSYFIHNSWGDGVEEKASLDKLPLDIREFLNTNHLDFNAGEKEINSWLTKQRDALRQALDFFSAANNFSEVLSSILAIDILISGLLTGLYKHMLTMD